MSDASFCYAIFVVRPRKPLPWMDGWALVNWNPPKRGDLCETPGLTGYTAWSGSFCPPPWPGSTIPMSRQRGAKARTLEEVIEAARLLQDLWEFNFTDGRGSFWAKWQFGLVLVSDGRWVLLDLPPAKISMPVNAQKDAISKKAKRRKKKSR